MAPLTEEPDAVGEAGAPVEAEALAASSASLPGPVPDRLVTGAEGEREKRQPVVGHLAEVWKKVWSAISSLVAGLR
jgi:hypothetical protein